MRDDHYLGQKLVKVWSMYFADIKPSNLIYIQFGRKVKKRLGSIRKCNVNRFTGNFDTLIYINGHFQDKYIPEFVVEATIAHELVHYLHGFSSPFPQLFKFPHRGGVIDKELARRGLQDLVKSEHDWLQANWLNYLAKVNSSGYPQKPTKSPKL